jgi:hypothetical protein
MRKFLLIAGIVIIVAFVVSMIIGALSLFGYYHVLDGSASLYARLHRTAVISFVIAGILAAAAIVCFIIRMKTKT